jgi:methylenetetrahydrofolate dehydrogenase (NADP+)/methenyltetrahydrofolate cyclohydrolase
MKEPLILDGKRLSLEIEEYLKLKVEEIVKRTDKKPTLATIMVGDNKASLTYIDMKEKTGVRIDINILKIKLPSNTSTEDVIKKVQGLNNDASVNGIMIQHPMPKHIDERMCFDAINTNKDVDGLSTNSFGKMVMGIDCFKPATPLAIMTLLDRYNIEIEGKEVIIVGRSSILGKPLAMMLLNANATVTICHSKTKDLPDILKRADIVISAVGKPHIIKGEWLKDNAVIIDTGYNKDNIGDIDISNINRLKAYTPIPGGVGPVTIIKLIEQVIIAFEKQNSFKKEHD